MTTYDSFLEDSFDRGFGSNERTYSKNSIDLEESDDFDDYFLTSDMDYDEADDDFDEDVFLSLKQLPTPLGRKMPFSGVRLAVSQRSLSSVFIALIDAL